MDQGRQPARDRRVPAERQGRPRARSGETVTVTDGPFAETKEVIGGFALLQAKSKQEAVELIKIFLKVAGDGECELRQLSEPPDSGPEFNPERTEAELRTQWNEER